MGARSTARSTPRGPVPGAAEGEPSGQLRGAPRLRAVFLGASNLSRGLPWIVRELRRRAGGPVEVLAVLGVGRSYGSWSRLLGVRRLPAVREAGVWPALTLRRERDGAPPVETPPVETLAWVCDVGNDLAYGAPPRRLLGWVDECLGRLSDLAIPTALVTLPVASLEALPAWGERLAARVLFPGRPVPRGEVLRHRVRRVDGRLRVLARRREVALVHPDPDWFGFDPIHIRRSRRAAAWGRILDALLPAAGAATGAPGGELGRLRHRRGVPGLRSAEVRLAGVPVAVHQPALEYADGTRVFLY